MNQSIDPLDITLIQRLDAINERQVMLEVQTNPVRLEIEKFLTQYKLTIAGVEALLKLIKKIAQIENLDLVQQLPASSRRFLRKRKVDGIDSDYSDTETQIAQGKYMYTRS